MAYVKPGVSATKLIETSYHQGILDDMFRQPEIVDAMIIEEDGSVSVYLEGETRPREIGRMTNEYKRCFGKSAILSWKVTGGALMNNLSRIDTNGVELTPKTFYGLNIQFKEP
jgi:hypothetical protein